MNKTKLALLLIWIVFVQTGLSAPRLDLSLDDAMVCSGEPITGTATISDPPPEVTSISITFKDEANNTLGSGTANADNSWTVSVSGIGFSSGLHTITASSDAGNDSKDAEWIRIVLDPSSANVEIRCDGDWPLTTVFALDSVAYAPQGATWSIAEDGSSLPTPDASMETGDDPTVGVVNVGTVPGAYWVTAVSIDDTDCSGTGYLTTFVDCDCTHHVSDGVDRILSIGDCDAGVTGDPEIVAAYCGSLTLQCVDGYVTATAGGATVGHCNYINSQWNFSYQKCFCGNQIKQTYFRVTRVASAGAQEDVVGNVGKMTTWHCGESPVNQCYTWRLIGGAVVMGCRNLVAGHCTDCEAGDY